MSRDILPIFADGRTPEPAARAMSEVFLQPEAFTVGLEHRAPDWKPEELIGLRTLYLAPREPGGIPGEVATVFDPAKRFEGRFDEAATAFLKAYYGRLAPLKAALSRVAQDALSQETLEVFSSNALHIVSRSSLKTVVALAVTGTPESPVAELVVPQKVSNELGVLVRDIMLSDPSSVQVSEEMRPRIMTQHPVVQDLGMLAAANLLPLDFA